MWGYFCQVLGGEGQDWEEKQLAWLESLVPEFHLLFAMEYDFLGKATSAFSEQSSRQEEDEWNRVQ